MGGSDVAKEPGSEAMGDFEGFFPPRPGSRRPTELGHRCVPELRWWTTWGRTAMGSCPLIAGAPEPHDRVTSQV